MKTGKTPPKDIDEYIAAFPNDVHEILQKTRRTIREAAPDAQETIKYAIPTFTLHGNLIHFGGYKKHVGLYPVPRGNDMFTDELSPYEGGPGTAKFPLDKPIPFDLISRIVKFRVKSATEAAEAKRKKP